MFWYSVILLIYEVRFVSKLIEMMRFLRVPANTGN